MLILFGPSYIFVNGWSDKAVAKVQLLMAAPTEV
jgi:hypothetical protein